jgi:hypothetical protein
VALQPAADPLQRHTPQQASNTLTATSCPDSVDLERRNNGTIIVRVHSFEKATGLPLPDAVFTFRRGDPQYEYWNRRWQISLESGAFCEAG